MPVVVVTAPPLPPAELLRALADLNTAVAGALGLPADGVHSMAVEAVAAATGTAATAAWPTAVLHGGARDPAAMARALTDAGSVLAAAWRTDPEHVWTQWSVR